MKNLWHVLRGLLIALASVGLLFGGLSLSLAENHVTIPPTPTPPPTLSATLPATATPTLKPFVTAADTFTSLPPTSTPTPPPPPTNCPPPSGWVAYVVKTGDTLALLARRYGVSIDSLKQGNCLVTNELTPGAILYVPPSPTQTRVPCGPPSGWILTSVQPGDTLFRLSQAYGITVTQLQSANCMGNSTFLRVGQSLYVPPWAPHTPSPTFPGMDTPTYVPTDTFSEFTPTDTIFIIPSDTPSETPIPTYTPG